MKLNLELKGQSTVNNMTDYLTELETTIEVLTSLSSLTANSENIVVTAAIRQLEEGAALLRSVNLNLRDVSESSNLVPFALGGMLNELFNRYKKRANEQGIEFYLWFATPIPRWVNIDKDLLILSLLQLLERAFHATDQGRITLKLSHSIQLSKLIFEVLDTGITKVEILNNNAKIKVGYIKEELVSRLAENLTIESIEGVGSKISISLPIGEFSSETLNHVSSLPRANNKNDSTIEKKLRNISGRLIGIAASRSYRDLIRSITSYGNCDLIIRQSVFQFKEIVFSTSADLIFIEGISDSNELLSVIHEIRSRQIQTPILVLRQSQLGQETESLVRYGVEEISLPLDPRSFIEIFTRYMPSTELKTSEVQIASDVIEPVKQIATSSFDSVKTSLLSKMDPEQAENVSRFITNLPAEIGELENLLSKADIRNGAFLANELGGTACIVGLQSLGEELLAIEKAAKQGSKEKLTQHLKKAKQLLSEIPIEIEKADSLLSDQDDATILTEEIPTPTQPNEEKLPNLTERDPIVSSVTAESPELLPLVNDFLSSLDDYIDKLTRAAGSNHYEALGKTAHETAGVSALYGYPALSVAAKKLQHLAESKNTDEINSLLGQIIEIAEDMKRGRELMIP